MEKHIWMIFGIVVAVAVVGIVTIIPTTDDSSTTASSPSGNVVLQRNNAPDCGACSGSPVCATKNNKAFNYENACKAQCDDARIVYDDVCERIPHAQTR